MKNKIIIATCVVTLLGGCSVYKASTQAGPADLTGIGIGTPRQVVISKLGAPKMVDTDQNGGKQDMFEFQSGMHQASKARIILYLAADIFTLSLAELILWPLELTVMESATCTGLATYDVKLKIESWSVTNKQTSAQAC